jgi:hypothetical protein
MYMVKVVIATTGTKQPVIPDNAGVQNSNTCFQSMIPQNNGANIMYLGDPSVTTTNSLQLPAASSLGDAQAFSSNPGDLKDFWVIGTAADILNILVMP